MLSLCGGVTFECDCGWFFEMVLSPPVCTPPQLTLPLFEDLTEFHKSEYARVALYIHHLYI